MTRLTIGGFSQEIPHENHKNDCERRCEKLDKYWLTWVI